MTHSVLSNDSVFRLLEGDSSVGSYLKFVGLDRGQFNSGYVREKADGKAKIKKSGVAVLKFNPAKHKASGVPKKLIFVHELIHGLQLIDRKVGPGGKFTRRDAEREAVQGENQVGRSLVGPAYTGRDSHPKGGENIITPLKLIERLRNLPKFTKDDTGCP